MQLFNRREFFKTLGVASLIWPIAKQIQLPGSYIFQPEQLLTKAFFNWNYHYNFDNNTIILIATFKNTHCLNCNFSDTLYYYYYFSEVDLLNYKEQLINGQIIEIKCPKCKFLNKYRISKDCQWEEHHE